MRDNREMGGSDLWVPVWAALSDESLEHRLRHYYWLSTQAPNLYQKRFELRVVEAERRGKPELTRNAMNWVRLYGCPPPI